MWKSLKIGRMEPFSSRADYRTRWQSLSLQNVGLGPRWVDVMRAFILEALDLEYVLVKLRSPRKQEGKNMPEDNGA